MKKLREQKSIDDVVKSYKTYKDGEEYKKIEEAYNFVSKIYDTETLIHTLSVSYILTTVYMDVDTIIAGLLHSVNTIEYEDVISNNYGNDVLKLINGVSKISKINFSCENDYLIEYYKKIIVGMSEDVRVIIIKLADRLDNMRNLFLSDVDIVPHKFHKINL